MTTSGDQTAVSDLRWSSEARDRYLGAYGTTTVQRWETPIDPDVELTQTIARLEASLGYRPTVLFTDVVGCEGPSVLGNPYPRSVVLAGLGLESDEWPHIAVQRLRGPSPGFVHRDHAWQRCGDLGGIPWVRHRPGDAGAYITAGVAVTQSFATGRTNLGVYRIQLTGPRKGLIFFDPKTDAYRNLEEHKNAGRPMPIAIFAGASPTYALVAAAKLPAVEDDFDVVARLTQLPLTLTGSLPVPVDASVVIRGHVVHLLEEEGPFAEFKGYYVPARRSHVLEVDEVLYDDDSVLPTIVTGAESGLTLMSMQNEMLMFDWLVDRSLPVSDVRYPLTARGEFLALIESADPSQELLTAAMEYDSRCKLIMVGASITEPFDVIGTHRIDATLAGYLSKGKPHGDRIGIVITTPPAGRAVEF